MPLSRRQILRRRRITVFGGLGLALSTAIYLPLTLLAPLDEATATATEFSAPVTEQLELDFPDFGATAVGAIGFEGTLASSGTTKPVAIASITKVVTVLVTLEEKPLLAEENGPTITTTQNDVDIYNRQVAWNGSVAPVRPGLNLTERQLIELILVKSSNNYSETLVNWAFGSEELYLDKARAWLVKNKLDDTFLTDSTGLDSGNRSTSADLIELAKLALAHPVVSVVVDTEKIQIDGIGELKNTNALLPLRGIRGIKTGTTDDAGACLLFAADYTVGAHTVTVVGVMLGGENHPSLNERIRSLLSTVKKSFHEVELTEQGAEFGSFDTEWGDSATAIAATDASALVWRDEPITADIRLDPIVTAERGSRAGVATFTIGDETITVPLKLSRTIDDPGPWWRLSNPNELF